MGDMKTRFVLEGEQQYRSAMTEAANAVKVLNAQQKLAKVQFENTGNAEKYAAQQAEILKQKIEAQKSAVAAAEKALKQLSENGVSENSKQFQQWQMKLLNAQTALTKTETDLQNLTSTMQSTSTSADKLAGSVDSIGKKISLDQVITGINSITTGLSNAARKAVELGETIWNEIMNSARWADDTAQMAQMYEIPLERLLQIQGLVASGMDTSADAILGAQQKLTKNIGKGTKTALDALKELGIGLRTGVLEDPSSWHTKDPADLFWEVGEAIMNMGDAFDKESAAQALFGKSWRELIPLFSQFKNRNEFNEALEGVNINSSDTVENLATLNDKVMEVEYQFGVLKTEILGSLAPALTQGAEAISKMLGAFMDYLETPEGREALGELGDAVSRLFGGIEEFDPSEVVRGLADALNAVVDAFEWISDNWGTITTAIEGIGIAFGLLNAAELALNIGKIVSGFKELFGLRKGNPSTPTAPTAPTAPTGGTGTTGGGWTTSISNWLNGILPGVANWVSVNGGPVWDWLTHESPFAGMLNGKESLGEWWNSTLEEVQKNADTIDQDWKENKIYQFFEDGVEQITKDVNNTIKYWQGIHEVNKTAAEFTLGDEYSAEELLAMLRGEEEPQVTVEVVAEPDASEKLTKQVETVFIPAQLAVSGITWGGGGSSGLRNSAFPNLRLGWPSGTQHDPLMALTGYANGLPYVPSDGLYRLHRGERVTPAREAGRSFSSNLYVENMNMSGGADAEGLAAAIASRNRRIMAGYGS